jgi:hypothetical protein
MKIAAQIKTPIRTLYVIGYAIALMVLAARPLRAQQSLAVPVPADQATPSPYYRPPVAPGPTPPSRTVETIPQAMQSAQPPGPPPVAQPPSSPPEPILPAIFRGCWVGRVDDLDSITRLPGGPPLGTWTPKTYRLCYQRTANGPFELTFTEAGIARDYRITNATGRMDLRSTDGHTYAAMRALLHFDEYRTHAQYFAGSTFPVDELTQLQCEIVGNGMRVTGQVYGEHGGTSWFEAAWHATFLHTADEPTVTE